MLDQRSLSDALAAVGELLADRGHEIEIVAIGGLLLLGLIERSTKDLDLVGLVSGDRLVKPVRFLLRSAKLPTMLDG